MIKKSGFDRTNAIIAGLVFLTAFIVYVMTVQRSVSFWDCGEFIASAWIMGIPHPPGTPFLMILGRVIALIPFVEDISHRINYLSVISSAFTAMFSYLLVVRIVALYKDDSKNGGLKRIIGYIGGIVGALFVAFSATNWANAVEAEAYGLALALSVAIIWLTVRYYEVRGTHLANRIMILVIFLAMLGVGIHMTVFLVVPICAIFFILKRDATAKDYILLSAFGIVELLLVVLLSGSNNGAVLFKFLTVIIGLALFGYLRKKINWGILIAIAATSSVMMSFELYLKWATPLGILAILGIAALAKSGKWRVKWTTALAMVFVGLLGFSTHLYIPIRSSHNPRIDENNPSRDFRTFINFLDRKQYGQTSMVDRMFKRRGLWENQLGRHPHMGYWSYFEEQYSKGGLAFVPFLLLGLLGMIVAIKKRAEIGMPFFTLFILGSLGLALYMNFADGTQYNMQTNDAYLEVRNRDYFFTPAFVFFGIAMGLGASAIISLTKDGLAKGNPSLQRTIVYAGSLLILLPIVSLSKNYHMSDRSNNYIPYLYSKNILDSCPPNAILFTSGDNDTFPVWCLQEVYNYRRDVRVVNLSLLNTDWYVAQMKNRYDVPISLSDEQILWNPIEINGQEANRPDKMFIDRPRNRQTYLWPSPFDGRLVKVQDMMVDEIVLENNWKVPICFSSPPYAESPLGLRSRVSLTGLVYTLQRDKNPPAIDVEKSYDLFMNTFDFSGYESSEVYRDENATGVFLGVGVSGIRVADQLMKQGDTTRSVALLEKLHTSYPEYWQAGITLAELAEARGDSAESIAIVQSMVDTMQSFVESNPENIFYRQDLGLLKTEIGRRNNDPESTEEGLKDLWAAFEMNPNNNYGFRKLVTVMNQTLDRNIVRSEMRRAAEKFSEYKINRSDPLLKQVLQFTGMRDSPGAPPPPAP